MPEPASPLLRLLGFLGIKRLQVAEHERGVLYQNATPKRLLPTGAHWRFDPLGTSQTETFDRRAPLIPDDRLDLLLRSGLINPETETLDLLDHQRAMVWVDGRFHAILGPGRHAWWKGLVKVETEVADIRANDGAVALKTGASLPAAPRLQRFIQTVDVPAEAQAAFYRNGELKAILPPGRHRYWLGSDENTFKIVDIREHFLDLSGQELLTADKLPVRFNAVLSYKIQEVEKSLLAAADVQQALYREAQLVLRAAVGGRDLERLLAEKEELGGELKTALQAKAGDFGLAVASFGVKDIILPGDIKELLLKAVAARKESEAATIVRREETAALRHQLNSAKLLSDHPALMRLRELETLEKVAAGGKLKVVVGEKGLREKVAELL